MIHPQTLVIQPNTTMLGDSDDCYDRGISTQHFETQESMFWSGHQSMHLNVVAEVFSKHVYNDLNLLHSPADLYLCVLAHDTCGHTAIIGGGSKATPGPPTWDSPLNALLLVFYPLRTTNLAPLHSHLPSYSDYIAQHLSPAQCRRLSFTHSLNIMGCAGWRLPVRRLFPSYCPALVS